MGSAEYLAAVVIVTLVPAFGVIGAIVTWRWARTMIEWAPVVGIIGVGLTLMASFNVMVPRVCDSIELPEVTIDRVNRPLLSAIVDDGNCYRKGLGQMNLIAVSALATTTAVRLRRPPESVEV